MPMKAGMADSGRATAETTVARKSRRNSQTTSTASRAPSYNRVMEALNSSSTGVTKSNDSVICRSGRAACNSLSLARTPCPTSTSLAPLLRATSKPTTGLPSRKAAAVGSAMVSFTVAIWSSRMRRPSDSESSSAASSSADFIAESVRSGCWLPPMSARPPALSICTRASWRDMSAAVAPSACSLSGSSRICTSRLTPPTRLIAPTPRTDSSSLATSLSTNQEMASSSILSERTV